MYPCQVVVLFPLPGMTCHQHHMLKFYSFFYSVRKSSGKPSLTPQTDIRGLTTTIPLYLFAYFHHCNITLEILSMLVSLFFTVIVSFRPGPLLMCLFTYSARTTTWHIMCLREHLLYEWINKWMNRRMKGKTNKTKYLLSRIYNQVWKDIHVNNY